MRTPAFVVAAWPIATLVAIVSLGGLVVPGVYARETAAWTAQAVGQDWFDLVVAAPAIAIYGVLARRSSRWRAVLAGAYGYAVYELLIYVFAVHLNALFLLYCATLGGASFALIALAGDLRARAPALDRGGAHLAGGFLVGVGVLFALLWLGEDVPALLRQQPPASLVEVGLATNPVHVIDLSFVLPLHVVVGVLAWRGRPAGAAYAPVLLAFGALMAASIGGMLIVMRGPAAVIAAMLAVALASAAILVRVSLRGSAKAEPLDRRAGARHDAAIVERARAARAEPGAEVVDGARPAGAVGVGAADEEHVARP